MRLRVLGLLSLFSIIIVVAVTASILSSASRELTQELQINRASALNRIAQVAYDSALGGDTAQLAREMERYSDLYGEGVLVRLQEGTLSSGGLTEDRAEVRDAVARARLSLSDTSLEPLAPFGPRTEVVSRPFGTASQVLGEAVLEVDLEPARGKLRERWIGVALGAAALWLLLLLGAYRATAWVLRPVHRLTEAVAELGASGRSAPLADEGPPELRQLSRAFGAMAQTVGESLESQRQLIADASHQLRNPIGALRLRVDLLQLELARAGQSEAAAGVVQELEHVEALLDGLLRLAAAEHRVSEGSAAVAPGVADPGVADPGAPDRERPEPIDPYPVLEEEADRARPAADRAGATLVLAPPPREPLLIACRASELADMVAELIGNAVKYAPGARIEVGARRRGGAVVVEVADDGPGLSEDELAAATGRFWRSPRHRDARGTGLGMTIVDRLAGANGAWLLLAGRDPHGLAASIEFPVPPAQPVRPEPHGPQERPEPRDGQESPDA